MRITAELFVSQLVRRVFNDGGFAAIVRRGAEAAGAVFVIIRGQNGASALYGPAVQMMAADDGERRFMRENVDTDEAIERRMEREERFDPDFWLVELETGTPERYLTLVE
ncbi:DUF1491 family protein [Aureimonas fodinaquatilis]|uniref:DUF1491 family protein n=1 Tax=Aureimonas fodinaquatilis TaxID=2565783 RepID=A0A5B0DYK6_9HYPH|nr:DUF1491 family protein [Aureimonas fodinaquatilis]KAA0971092.1 DUF1491 family protein [Aureimonas fodinaquatilis]